MKLSYLYESLGFPTATSTLTPEQRKSIVDLSLVTTLHTEALSFTRSPGRGLPRNGRGLIKLVIPFFIKHLKRNGVNLTPFYDKANTIFDRFISGVTFSIQPWYNLDTHCLTSDYSMGLNAIELAKSCELDSTDAIHLSVAFRNNCEYFVTKDSDLSSININGLGQHQKLVGAFTGTDGIGIRQPIKQITGTILYMP